MNLSSDLTREAIREAIREVIREELTRAASHKAAANAGLVHHEFLSKRKTSYGAADWMLDITLFLLLAFSVGLAGVMLVGFIRMVFGI